MADSYAWQGVVGSGWTSGSLKSSSYQATLTSFDPCRSPPLESIESLGQTGSNDIIIH